MIKDLVVLGVGFPDIIQTIEDINQDTKIYNLLGFIDDNPEFKDKTIYDYPVLGTMEWLRNRSHVYVVNTVAKNMTIRKNSTIKLNNLNANFLNIIHPTVNTKYTKIGLGNILCKNVYLEAQSVIGSHCMLLPNVTIGHDTSINDNCFFGPNSSILGGVKINENCLIGSGTVILPKVKIDQNVVLGINSSVYSNVDKGKTLMSPPSRKIFNYDY